MSKRSCFINLQEGESMMDARRFENLSRVKIQRRGWEDRWQMIVVIDGADWLRSLIEIHSSQRTRSKAPLSIACRCPGTAGKAGSA
jgi:hypothetical protein